MRRRLSAISAVDQPGGAEIHLLRLTTGLAPCGWEVTVTTPGSGPLAGYSRAVRESGEVEHCAWSENAPGLVRHLDVLVLPSYEEPFGVEQLRLGVAP
jgi:hypothetical protein